MNLQHVGKTGKVSGAEYRPAGLAGWLLKHISERIWDRLRNTQRGFRKPEARLALVERITLAPRQTLALVEAEGQRFLVACSAEGAPTFFALDGGRSGMRRAARVRGSKARIAW